MNEDPVTEPETKNQETHAHEHDEHDHDHDHDHGHAHEHGEGEHRHTVTSVLEELGPCKKLLKVSVPANEVKDEIEAQLVRLRKQVRLKGFRQGKVPAAMVRKLYGDAVKDDVRKHLLEESYLKALKDKGVEARSLLGETKIEKLQFSPESGLAYEVTLQIRPTFELPEYKGVEVALPALKIAEEDVDKALENFRRAKGEIRPVEEADAVVEAEDFLTCDVEIWLADEWETFAEAEDERAEKDAKEGVKTVEGKKVEPAKTEPSKTDDDESAEPGHMKPLKELKDQDVHVPVPRVAGLDVEDMGDGLIGLKVGEWGEAETDLPVDYEVVEGRNEPAIVRLKVNGIKRLFLPPLTDEWAKEAGYDSVEDLRREAREDLFRRKELERQDEIESKLLDALLAKVGNFPLPTDLLEAELKDTERRRAAELEMEGKSKDEAQRLVLDEAAETRTNVERSLRCFFILDEVAKREKLQVKNADVDSRIARIAQASGKTIAEVRKYFEERNIIPQIRHEILNEKTRGLLREHAKVVDRTD